MIRQASRKDEDAIWEIFRSVIASGDTCAFDPAMPREDANEPAVRLWKQLGFEIIGTLPGAYRHAQLGFVDAHAMFQTL